MSFSDEVRDELAHADPGDDGERRAELAAVLRLGGSLALRGGQRGPGWTLETASAALARRVRVAVRELGGADGSLEMQRPNGLRRAATYRVRLGADAGGLLADLGLLDDAGGPARAVAPTLTRRPRDAAAYVRGALLTCARLSAPRHAPHLEFGLATEPTAHHLEGVLRRLGAPGARTGRQRAAWRVVVKSGEEIAALLARAGAHDAFLRYDAARLGRELRVEANRVTNADRANLRRAASAAARHVEAVERVLAERGWDGLGDEERELALVRLANPEASLAELGRLLDPPVGKTTVHRRLTRLLAMADQRP